MADNGRWFKLWCSALDDSDLDNLDIADFGRWVKLGAYIKEHGDNGEIVLVEPARVVVSMLQVSAFQCIFDAVKRFKNVTVSCETNAPVSIRIIYENWHKYQGDFSSDRVRKHRSKKGQNETPKKRREEKRGEESIGDAVSSSVSSVSFDSFWSSYPRRVSRSAAMKAWIKVDPSQHEKIIQAIEHHKKSEQWKKDDGKFIPHPATWINQRRWEDELQPAKQGDPGLSAPQRKDPGL